MFAKSRLVLAAAAVLALSVNAASAVTHRNVTKPVGGGDPTSLINSGIATSGSDVGKPHHNALSGDDGASVSGGIVLKTTTTFSDGDQIVQYYNGAVRYIGNNPPRNVYTPAFGPTTTGPSAFHRGHGRR